MLIKEQMRKYKVKMEEISQLEAAESIAVRRLSLLRQNAVRGVAAGGRGIVWAWPAVGGARPEQVLPGRCVAGREHQVPPRPPGQLQTWVPDPPS